MTDPDTDDVEDDKAAQGEFLDLAKTFGGYHVAGFLTDEHGLLVTAAINAVMGAPAAEDTRTTTQRRAQGLADLARVVLDTNQASPGAAIPPHLNVTVSWTELVTQATRTRDGLCLTCGQNTRGTRTATTSTTDTTVAAGAGGAAGGATDPGGAGGSTAGTTTTADWDGAGWNTAAATASASKLLSSGGPVFTETGDRVPRALLRRLACDSAVTRIVFGPDGAALDVGRAQRTVTGQMRRAVIARDEHCVYPGCDQPPSRCEVHHAVRHWADGGDTSVANSALLCWHHHQLVDARGITMHWTGKPTTTTTSTASTGTSTSSTGTTSGVAGALVETGWAFTDARGHRIRLPEPIDALPPGSEATIDSDADPPSAEAA